MVKIRLTRVGRKKAPYFRLVVADSRRQRDGKCIEIIGRYQPLNPAKDQQIVCDEARAMYWLNNGAQPTETVRSLLSKAGIMKKFHDGKQAARKERQAATA